ncbi:MAG: hypothetical protein OXE78_06315 [Gammaproteobacteria bacterium]|nr:hypothetical protein [Gammaproteobacteria bacterium]
MGIAACFDVWIGHFSLKYPSLLSFDRASRNDMMMRERLDKVDPFLLRDSFKKVFASFKRGKGLEQFTYLGHCLLSVDGTGYFSSPTVKCDQCFKKHHRDGSVSYYHMMLGAVLVYPWIKHVIPLPPEQIMNEDGSKRNDCERNAGNRMLPQIRREQDMRYILVAKPKDHKFRCPDLVYFLSANVMTASSRISSIFRQPVSHVKQDRQSRNCHGKLAGISNVNICKNLGNHS